MQRQTQIRLSEAERQDLAELAAAYNRSRSNMIRELIRQAKAAYEREQKAKEQQP